MIAHERILITVRTYPNLSSKYSETVCTGGINDRGEWRRLYPVSLRHLDDDKTIAAFGVSISMKKRHGVETGQLPRVADRILSRWILAACNGEVLSSLGMESHMSSSLLIDAPEATPAKLKQVITPREARVRSPRLWLNPARAAFIERIRAQIGAGTYETDEKMAEAIDRLLALL